MSFNQDDQKSLSNSIITDKIIKLAKKNLTPAKALERPQVKNHWRAELTSKQQTYLTTILLISLLFSIMYWWQSRTKIIENSFIDIPVTNSVEQVDAPQIAISEVVIYVTGDVTKSGVYTLPSGSRVIDVLNVAGGLIKNGKIGDNNLARLVSDGEQIDFSLQKVNSGSKSKLSTGKSSQCINLNTASASELDLLPGVGPVLAQRILEWRESNGRFSAIEQLGEVDGIGKAKYSTISAKSCV